MKYSLYILILIGFFSCNKVKPDYKQLIGDYQWVFSSLSMHSSVSDQQTEDKYGVKILKNGRLIYFHNDEKIINEKIKDIKVEGENIKITIIKKNVSYQFIFSDNKLYSGNYPFGNYENQFNKIK